jgi:hypothetical protein
MADLNPSFTFRYAAHPIAPSRGLDLGRQPIRRQTVIAPHKIMLQESDVGVYDRVSALVTIGLPHRLRQEAEDSTYNPSYTSALLCTHSSSLAGLYPEARSCNGSFPRLRC